MIGVIDYGAGNLTSVVRALQFLEAEFRVADRPTDLVGVDGLVFPGVGHAGSAMETLRRLGWDDFLRNYVATGRPLLGICLGSQILLDRSEEGPTECLGLIPGEVRAFDPGMGLKIPQIGWNTVDFLPHPVFDGLDPRASFYFVHGFYTDVTFPEHRLGTTVYGRPYTSALGKDNVVAVQFHPEKSGKPGLRLLSQFLDWRP